MGKLFDRAGRRPQLVNVISQLNEAIVYVKEVFVLSPSPTSSLNLSITAGVVSEEIAVAPSEVLNIGPFIENHEDSQKAEERFLTTEMLGKLAFEELFKKFNDARGYSNNYFDEYSVALKFPLPLSADAESQSFELMLCLMRAITTDHCSARVDHSWTRDFLCCNAVMQSYIHNRISDPGEYIEEGRSLYYSTDTDGLCGAVVSFQVEQKVRSSVFPEYGGLQLKTTENNRRLLSAYVETECISIAKHIDDLRSKRDENELHEIIAAAKDAIIFLESVKSHINSALFSQDFPSDNWVDLRPLMLCNGNIRFSAYQRIDNSDGYNILMYNSQFHGLNDSSISYMDKPHANFEGRYTLLELQRIASMTTDSSSDSAALHKIICSPSAKHHFNMATSSSSTEFSFLEDATKDLLANLILPSTVQGKQDLMQLCITAAEYLDVISPLSESQSRSPKFVNLKEQLRHMIDLPVSNVSDNDMDIVETSNDDLPFLEIICNSLGFVNLRENQIAILMQAIIEEKDIIWNAACNAGKTVLPMGLGIMSQLCMHDLGENTTIIHFGHTTAFMLNLLDQIQKCVLLKNVVCAPGQREFSNLKLEDAILSKKYRYIIIHVSRFVTLCGHGANGTVHNLSDAGKFDLARQLLEGPFKDFGKHLHLVYDEAHSFLQLPFKDIQTSLDLIDVLCKNSKKYVLTATTLAGAPSNCVTTEESEDRYDNILMTKDFLIKFFKLNREKLYTRIESSRRPGIQRLTINMANIFTVDALSKSQVMLQSFHLVNIHTLHKYAIVLDGILLVYCNGYKEAEKVKKAYELAHPRMGNNATCIIAGTKYMKTQKQDEILSRINDGSSITICFATNVIALGLNIKKVKGVYHYGDPQDGYSMEQFINRVDRGVVDIETVGMRPVCVNAIPTACFQSDWQNVTNKENNNDKFSTDLQGKRLLRSLVCSSKCTNHLLDEYLPAQHIDGIPTESNKLSCDMCPACINGTQEVDITAAAMLIILTVEESRETLPTKAIVLILTKGNIKEGSNEDDYFRGDSPIVPPASSFSTYGRLQHCEVNQVTIQFKYMFLKTKYCCILFSYLFQVSLYIFKSIYFIFFKYLCVLLYI